MALPTPPNSLSVTTPEHLPRSGPDERPFATRVADCITGYVLPAGLVLLLTGMIWSGNRSLYHQFFYWLIALPAALLVAVRRDTIAHLVRSPIVVAFLVFATYAALSLSWSDPDQAVTSLIKRPLYVLLVFAGIVGLTRYRYERLVQALTASAWIAVAGAIVLLAGHALDGHGDRLTGYGAFGNPLLISHVFGFFLVLWLAHWTWQGRPFAPSVIVAVLALGALIVATGSRTPLVALTVTVAWLALLLGNRRGVMVLIAYLAVAAIVATGWSDLLAQRGLSFRPQIWNETIRLIMDQPLAGHGYGNPLQIRVEGLDLTLSDPHNLALSVLYQCGAIGLVLWISLYATALTTGWRLRRDRAVFIGSAPVVYGLVAGLTEGGAFLSGPKEHWFLVWIPLALLAAAGSRYEQHGKA